MTGAKVSSERRNVRKKLFFQTAISRELSDKIEDFCEKVPGYIGLNSEKPVAFCYPCNGLP